MRGPTRTGRIRRFDHWVGENAASTIGSGPMAFRTDVQRLVHEKIGPWLREYFGPRARVRDDVPLAELTFGSALTQVGVFPRGDTEAVIVSRSYLVAGARLDAELYTHLLRVNAERDRMGAFGIDADGQILFQHAILGTSCSRSELLASVSAVARAADDFDDEIVWRWGGQRVGLPTAG